MINNFEIILGIEVHVALNTKTKMFSPSKSSHNDDVNTNINAIDLGFPGTLPSPNIEAVKKGILLSKALNMEIAKNLTFDRKNYFYQDLPKGFQITQQFNPLGSKGFLKVLDENGKEFLIKIQRLHLEEDTAKQFNDENSQEIFLDYNRAGVPLIEIVTETMSCSPIVISNYLKQLRKILIFNNISNAKLEDGSMRVDVNISLRPFGTKQYGTKVEIKNINSISNVEKAIYFEADRQSKLILKNIPISQETRKYNDKTMETEFMREKSNAVEYRYMNEPNFYIKKIDDFFLQETLKNYFDVDQNIKNLEKKLSIEFINIIFETKLNYEYFSFLNNLVNDESEVCKWLFLEMNGILTKDNKSLESLDNSKLSKLAEMIILLKKGFINGKQGKEIIKHIYETNLSINDIIEKFNFKQITDEKEITSLFQRLIDANLEMMKQYKERPERVEKFYLGLVMKETNGQINPQIAIEVFRKIVSKF